MIENLFNDGYHQVIKAWGKEIWLTNTRDYCAKLLIVNAGWQCSKHKHPIKNETFFVLSGVPLIEIEVGQGRMNAELKAPGDSVFIPRNTFHRFSATEGDVTLLEISTTHSDDDVIREEDSRQIEDLPF